VFYQPATTLLKKYQNHPSNSHAIIENDLRAFFGDEVDKTNKNFA
jgi:hypothetical protein